MKKIITVIFLLMTFASVTMADEQYEPYEPLIIDECQTPQCPCIKIQKRMKMKKMKLYARLEMTNEQRRQAYALDKKYIPQLTRYKMTMMKTINPLENEKIKKNPLEKEHKKAEKLYNKTFKIYDEEFCKILDKEQLQEYKALKKKEKEKRKSK